MYKYARKGDGKEFKLIEAKVILRGGREAKVYYFIPVDAKTKRGREINSLPEGYEIRDMGAGRFPIASKVRR